MSRMRGKLAKAVEAKIAAQRMADVAQKEVLDYYLEQRSMDTASASMLKDDLRRRDREVRERHAEQAQMKALYEQAKSQELAKQSADEEHRIATEVLRRHQETARCKSEVKKIWETSAELRELAERIQTARVTKERSLQQRERQLMTAQQVEYEAAFDAALERQRQHAVEREEAHQMQRRQNNIRARHVLEEQIQERQDQQRAAATQYEQERAMIDAVVAAIDEEDRLEAQLKREKQDATKKYIRDFLEERHRQIEAERHAEREEELRIQAYNQQVADREAQEQARLAARKEEADRIYDRIKAEMEAKAAAKDEEERLINLLHEEEEAAKQKAAMEQRERRRQEMVQEMVQANQFQRQLKAEREAARLSEEQEFRQKMLEKFAEDDRIDQMNAQRRRQKQIEHRREVERLIAEKRAMFERAREQEKVEMDARRAEEQRVADVVEKERQKLLAEAADLLDFLPKGVLRDQQDLAYVQRLKEQP